MGKRLIYLAAAVLAVIFILFVVIVIFTSRSAEAPEVKVEPEFMGPPPGAAPYVKGPTKPPPSY